ncbi:MAG: glycosyltransferase [Muribaculaceae bacterium]|nr:glycosyltransferase [Muribaculaceae bacterium]
MINDNSKTILLIGPRLNKDNRTIGGSEVLFENFINYCKKENRPIKIIDSNKFNYSNLILALASILLKTFKLSKNIDHIFLYGSKNDYLYIAPLVAIIAKLRKKQYSLRKFGGDFDSDYYNSFKLIRCGINYAMRNAKTLFWETKRLLPFGLAFNIKSYWAPNTRRKPIYENKNISFNKRKIAFISHVRKEKGIYELIEALNQLGEEFSVDIYGTVMDIDNLDISKYYKGIIPPEDVQKVLSEYSALILPTWKEGYPGIIIESFSCGVPVLASKVGGIPEMIEHGKNGILFDPKDPNEIVRALKNFENYDYNSLVKNSLSSFNYYEESAVNNMIFSKIFE